MIKIARPPAPAFLLDIDDKWQKETQRAIEHYESGNTTAFKFELYNDSKVKDALKEVFSKCAYCESSYGAVYDGDVEHFRPKGRVKEKDPPSPGYYWLANDWDNLLLACQHCNQNRKHKIPDEDKARAMGKLDQFPIGTESKRVTKHTHQLLDEESVRLLLNPCIDNPSAHFAYEDKEAVIVPLTDKGKASVEVYVLKRHLLVQERKMRMLLLFDAIDTVKRELERFNTNNSPAQKDILDKQIKKLERFTDKDAPYAGMCRFFVKKFYVENGLA